MLRAFLRVSVASSPKRVQSLTLRTEFPQQAHLRVARGLARPAAPIMPVALHEPGGLIVAEKCRQTFGDHAPLQTAIVDRERHFHAPEEIAVHPVGARQGDLLLAAVVEVENAIVCEKAPD